MRPYLGQVEGVVRGLVGIGLGHHLHLYRPLRKVPSLDGAEQVLLERLPAVADDTGRLLVGHGLVTLPGFEVKLHPESLAVPVPETEGVAAVAVHEPGTDRNAPVRHQYCHLVHALRASRPEVPHRRRRAQIGARMTFLRADEIGELEGIADEEHRRVVADQVPVALFGVELDRKSANVPFRVGGAEFARNGGESGQHRRLPAHLGKKPCPGEAGNVPGNGKGTECTPTLGMHDPFRDPFPVLVRQLFDELVVLHQHRPARSGGQAVLVVRHRIAAGGGHRLDGSIGHGVLLFSVSRAYCGDVYARADN